MEVISRNLKIAKFATIDAYVMTDSLREFGATDKDIEAWPKLWSATMGDDPSYSFRKSTQTRWHFRNNFTQATRLDKAKFILGYDENKSKVAGEEREFAEGSDAFLKSSVHHAMVKIMGCLLEKNCSDAKYKDGLPDGFISGFHQFRITINPKKPDDTIEGTTPNCPTPEGVHQDGAQLVFIMYMNSENMAPRSGESRIYSGEQPGGVLTREASGEARAKTRVAERNLLTPFESLVLCDREVKHDNRPIVAKDTTKPAFRDVLVFWARPFNEDDAKVTAPHPKLPFDLELKPNTSLPLGETDEKESFDIHLDSPFTTPQNKPETVGYPDKAA
jgi:hypothetical protein